MQMLWLTPGQALPIHGMPMPACLDQYLQAGWPLQTLPRDGIETWHALPCQNLSLPSTWHERAESNAVGTKPPHVVGSTKVAKPPMASTQRQKKSRRPRVQQAQKLSVPPSDDSAFRTGIADEPAEEESRVDDEVALRIQNMASDLLDELRGARGTRAAERFVRMAFGDETSSRAAQRALEEASAAEQMALSAGLYGQVWAAMHSKHANYVITKAIEVMPVDRVGFITEELIGRGCEVARHRFGCRVLCRILEHLSPRDEKSMQLLDEVLVETHSLCTHAFGSIVIRHFLEHGLPQHKRRIAAAVLEDVAACATQRKGSHVVEEALRQCAPEDRRLLAERLLEGGLAELAFGQFSRHVVLALLGTESEVRQRAIEALQLVAAQLAASKYGKTVLAQLPVMNPSDDARLSPSRL